MAVTVLLDAVHSAAQKAGVFEPGGIRTRLERREHYRVADCDPDNAFVYVGVRIGAGRSEDIRKKAGDALFQAACSALEDAYAAGPLAISLELSEIEPVTSFKKNNIHEHIKEKGKN